MVNYGNGKIYKLVSPHIDDIYIGSTCSTLARRKAGHKANYIKWKKGKGCKIKSLLLYALGVDDVEIILIEKFPCADKMELHKRERYWIEKLDCCNKMIPTRTSKEWYKDNKEKISEKHKAHYEANKEKISEKQKAYREDNKEKISEKYKEKKKAYYEANKEKIKAEKCKKVTCECGSLVRKGGIAKHKKSKKHKTLMEAK